MKAPMLNKTVANRDRGDQGNLFAAVTKVKHGYPLLAVKYVTFNPWIDGGNLVDRGVFFLERKSWPKAYDPLTYMRPGDWLFFERGVAMLPLSDAEMEWTRTVDWSQYLEAPVPV